ncbi:MAG: hypothetical protein Q6L68_07020 [Thermostichus sp. DG02_5_bins_236]
MEAVSAFLEKVAEDEALMNKDKLAQAIEAEDNRAAVAQPAIRKGLEITPDKLWTEVQKCQAEARAELSEEELEPVASRVTPIRICLPRRVSPDPWP